jgi:hypothetical protein
MYFPALSIVTVVLMLPVLTGRKKPAPIRVRVFGTDLRFYNYLTGLYHTGRKEPVINWQPFKMDIGFYGVR